MIEAKTPKKKESGQAILEYLFVVVVVVLVFANIVNNLASDSPTIGMCRFWGVIVRGVASACPNCPDVDTDLGDQPICR